MMTVLMPEVMDLVDHNIFGESKALFNDEIPIEQKKNTIELTKLSLWMLSNFVTNQKLDGYCGNLIISKHLYAQIIQIGMSSRAIVLEPETSKLMWEKF